MGIILRFDEVHELCIASLSFSENSIFSINQSAVKVNLSSNGVNLVQSKCRYLELCLTVKFKWGHHFFKAAENMNLASCQDKSNLTVCSPTPCCDVEPLLCASRSVTMIGVASRGFMCDSAAAGAVGGRRLSGSSAWEDSIKIVSLLAVFTLHINWILYCCFRVGSVAGGETSQ